MLDTGKTDTATAMSTPHASKPAAVLQIDAAELTALSTNPKNGSKTVPFKRPIRARFGGKTRETGLRCPFGAPKSFEATKTDRVGFNVSVDPEGPELAFANRLDTRAQALLTGRLEEFFPKGKADIGIPWSALVGKTTGLPSR